MSIKTILGLTVFILYALTFSPIQYFVSLFIYGMEPFLNRDRESNINYCDRKII